MQSRSLGIGVVRLKRLLQHTSVKISSTAVSSSILRFALTRPSRVLERILSFPSCLRKWELDCDCLPVLNYYVRARLHPRSFEIGRTLLHLLIPVAIGVVESSIGIYTFRLVGCPHLILFIY